MMYLPLCKNKLGPQIAHRQVTEKIGLANHKSAKCHICRTSANLSPQVCGFTICRTYLPSAHQRPVFVVPGWWIPAHYFTYESILSFLGKIHKRSNPKGQSYKIFDLRSKCNKVVMYASVSPNSTVSFGVVVDSESRNCQITATNSRKKWNAK
jgi:hypothetical protein